MKKKLKKILITGGAGTIGKAFIKRYQDKYKFYNMSRNEGSQAQLKREFPEFIKCTPTNKIRLILYKLAISQH